MKQSIWSEFDRIVTTVWEPVVGQIVGNFQDRQSAFKILTRLVDGKVDVRGLSLEEIASELDLDLEEIRSRVRGTADVQAMRALTEGPAHNSVEDTGSNVSNED